MGTTSAIRIDEFIPGWRKAQSSSGITVEEVGFFPYTVSKLVNTNQMTDIVGKVKIKNRFSYQIQLFKFESLGIRTHWESKFVLIFQANTMYVNQSKTRDHVSITIKNRMSGKAETAELPSSFITVNEDERLVTIEINSRNKQYEKLRPLRRLLVQACNMMREEEAEGFEVGFEVIISFIDEVKEEYDKIPKAGLTDGVRIFHPKKSNLELILKKPDIGDPNTVYKMRKSGRYYHYNDILKKWVELFEVQEKSTTEEPT